MGQVLHGTATMTAAVRRATSEAAVQRRARETRDGGLQCVEAIIEREQCVTAKRDDDSLIGDREAGPWTQNVH